MKKFCAVLLSTIVVFLCISPFTSFAEYVGELPDYGSEITDDLDSILSDYDLGLTREQIGSLSAGDVLAWVLDNLSLRADAPLRMLSAVFLVILFSTVMNSFGVGRGSREVYTMVCVMAAVMVIMPQLTAVYGEILRSVEITGSFILVFVPVLTAASAACGGFTSAGVYHMMMLGASEVIVKLSESWLLPILGVTAALAVTGSIFPDTSLESLGELLKKVITWGISITMTLFTGFVTLKCTIAGKADGMMAKTAKMLMSGFIPIVGGAVSDAYSTVKGSFDIIGGTVGMAGIIAVGALILPVLLEITVYRFVMWAGAAAADVFSAKAVGKLLRSMDSGLAIAQSVLVSYGVMFVLCSAILVQTF